MQYGAHMCRNENGPYAGRIKQHVDRMLALQMEVFEEGSRKRGPPEPTDGLDNTKRARLVGGPAGGAQPPPLPPGPATFAQLYTLTTDEALNSFDVTTIPLDLVIRITLAVLQYLDSMQLDEAMNFVRSRYLQLCRDAPAAPAAAIVGAASADDDDDYEPDFEPNEDREQVLNKLVMAPPDEEDAKSAPDLAIGTFKLPQPPPVTPEQAVTLGKGCIGRVFGMMNQLEAPDKTPKSGFNRLAGSRYDREAWVTVMTRLATRAHPEFEEEEQKATNGSSALTSTKSKLGDGIRDTLWQYVFDDFRRRMDVGIMWLNEEWYNDKITAKWAQQWASRDNGVLKPVAANNYEKNTLRLLDTIIPYLDAGDKLLIRFLGEIPEITKTIMDRVKDMAKDPDRISLTVKAL